MVKFVDHLIKQAEKGYLANKLSQNYVNEIMNTCENSIDLER